MPAQGRDTVPEGARPPEAPGTDIMRAEAMAFSSRAVLEPLVAALKRSQSRVSEPERESGGLANGERRP